MPSVAGAPLVKVNVKLSLSADAAFVVAAPGIVRSAAGFWLSFTAPMSLNE